jgi:hypothetical protein
MRKSELKEIIKSSFLAEAEDSKKGNSEEQKRAEGAIRDNKKHIKKLAADLKFQEEKLAKLKKDSKKDVIKEEVDVLGDEFTQEIQDDMKMYYKMDVDMDDIKDWVNMYYIGYNSEYDEGPGDVDYEGNEFGSEDYESEKKELVFDTAEREDFYMHLEDEADSTFPDLSEAEEVDVEDNENIDIDIEDEVDIDDEETESDIEIKTSVPGEDTDVEAVQGLLTKAQAEAEKLGDDKLLDQIGNTITYFTRAHVVKSANEDLESGEYGDPTDAELDVTKGGGDVAGILDAESELNLQEVKRFRKLAGLLK